MSHLLGVGQNPEQAVETSVPFGLGHDAVVAFGERIGPEGIRRFKTLVLHCRDTGPKRGR